ncbi:transglutaminase-like domain-containing protein [Flavobacterium daejeonense]|uniref:transglutaminase-like domain-containing protein n=1 Tax=Flavobacterium daejeonense TaxID=350893 RepID=UPI00047CC012|nr:transglutaminase-like domain-containing protein [Flavobacterium daejeonense]
MKKISCLVLVFTIIPFLAFSQIKNRVFLPKYEALLHTALEKSGDRKDSLQYLLNTVPMHHYEAASFLIAYMPERDLKSLSIPYIKDQLDGAYKVKKEFSWCAKLPDSIFLNEVLPYYCFDENRDNWRNDFYLKFSPLVKDSKNVREAIKAVTANIRNVLSVDYNVNRSIVNISPFQSIKEKMATCTGLSFLLVDAFRSVGIPARMAGTPMWTNMKGNHSWVEVWVNGQWYFTEYYPEDLNKSWFLADAGRADISNPRHWIYASSYKPKETYFRLEWDTLSTAIHAENVTQRYIDLYEKEKVLENLKPDEVWISLQLYKSNKKLQRISEKVAIVQEGKELDFGFSPSPIDDLNKFLKFKVTKNNTYQFVYLDNNGKEKRSNITVKDKEELFDLYQE